MAAQQAQQANQKQRNMPQKFAGGRYKASATFMTIVGAGILTFSYYHYIQSNRVFTMMYLVVLIGMGHSFLETGSIRLFSDRKTRKTLVDFYAAMPLLIGMVGAAFLVEGNRQGLTYKATHIVLTICLVWWLRSENRTRKREYGIIEHINSRDPYFMNTDLSALEGKLRLDLTQEKIICEQYHQELARAHQEKEQRRFLMQQEYLEKKNREKQQNADFQYESAKPTRKKNKPKNPKRLYGEFDQEIMANEQKEKEAAEMEQQQRKEIYEEALQELENLIGMENVKEEVRTFVADMVMVEKKKEAGIKHENAAMHMTFEGAAGTGKTTVARIISRILYGLGYLSNGHIVETDREGLIAGFVGQTAIKTKEKANEAMGGVLFIDEAYALTPRAEQGFEREAVDTLVKIMEDHRDNLVVIFAGYTDEMKEFMKSNSGLQSRVPYRFNFKPYTLDEMERIAQVLVKQKEHAFDKEANESLRECIASLMPYSANQNGRMVRNLLEKALKAQNRRLFNESPDDRSQYQTLKVIDLKQALDQVVRQTKEIA